MRCRERAVLARGDGAHDGFLSVSVMVTVALGRWRRSSLDVPTMELWSPAPTVTSRRARGRSDERISLFNMWLPPRCVRENRLFNVRTSCEANFRPASRPSARAGGASARCVPGGARIDAGRLTPPCRPAAARRSRAPAQRGAGRASPSALAVEHDAAFDDDRRSRPVLVWLSKVRDRDRLGSKTTMWRRIPSAPQPAVAQPKVWPGARSSCGRASSSVTISARDVRAEHARVVAHAERLCGTPSPGRRTTASEAIMVKRLAA